MQPTIDDIARLRSPRHKTDPILNIVPKTIVATAQVNQTSFVYPIFNLTVDNTSVNWLTAVKIGQLVAVGTFPGGDDVFYGVVRMPVTSTLIPIDAKGLGDPGYPQSIIQPVQDNYYVTVYKFRPPWGLLSSIRGGIFYKKWDVFYTDQLFKPDPIPRFGGWRQAFIDESTGTAFLDFSSTSYVWGFGNSVASVTWNLDGGTFQSGDLHSTSITAEFEPGFYEVELTIEDAKGKISTGYRYVWINTKTPDDANSPFSYNHVVRITTDSQEVVGRKMTFEVDGDVTDEVFPGQGYYFKEQPEFLINGNWERLDNEDDYPFSYTGYRSMSPYKVSKNLMTTTIETEGPGIYGNSVVTATQQIVETPIPLTWAQCNPILSNPVGAVWYSTYWHAPYLILGHDFEFDEAFISQYRRRSFQFGSTQIGPQLQGIAEMILGFIGWKSNGTMKMVRNPMYLTNSERNDMDTWWEWLPEDIEGKLDIVRSFKMPTGQTYGSAFSYDGTNSQAYASLAPGYSKAQGANTTQMTAFTVSALSGPAASQEEVNRLTGHGFAIENRKEPDFGITAMKNLDIVEPINADSWCILNVDASYDPEGFGWSNKRIIPLRVTRSWSTNPSVLKTIQTEFQVESFGQPGVTVPIDRGGANNWWTNQWVPGLSDPYEQKMPDLGIDIDIVYAWNDNGDLGRTQSFTRQQTEWDTRVTGFLGAVRDGCIDPTSPFFTNPDDPLAAWFVTDDGFTIRVYYLIDMFATLPFFFLEETFTAEAGYNGKLRVVSTELDHHLAIVAWKDSTGVKISRMSDSGHTWSAEFHIGATITDTDHDNEELGVSIKGLVQTIIAPDGSIDPGDGKYDYYLYQADGDAGSFDIVPNQPSGERAVLGCVQMQNDSLAIVGYEGLGTTPPVDPITLVTFDDHTGYPDWSTGIFSVGVVGPVPPAVYNPINGFGFNAVSCQLHFGAYFVFKGIEFICGPDGDYGSDGSGFTYNVTIQCYQDLGGPNQTLVAKKTFSTESTLYDPTKFKTSITASEIDCSEPFSDIQITVNMSVANFTGSIWYIYIDSLLVDADFYEQDSTRKTYGVTLPAGSWSDISPAVGSAPYTPYGVGTFTNKYSMIGQDENGNNKLFYSTSGGGAWVSKGKSKMLGVKRGDTLSVFFGYNSITVSKDNGSTQYSRVGDWVVKVGRLGIIKGFVGVF